MNSLMRRFVRNKPARRTRLTVSLFKKQRKCVIRLRSLINFEIQLNSAEVSAT